jgi:hypothetical protein
MPPEPMATPSARRSRIDARPRVIDNLPVSLAAVAMSCVLRCDGRSSPTRPMTTESVSRRQRSHSAPTTTAAAQLMEDLEPRRFLSAGDWRIATGVIRTTVPVRFNAAGARETATSVGNTAFFAGFSPVGTASNSMAAFDATSGRWTAIQISPAQSSGSLAAAGDTVLFSGNYRTVHLYDVQTHALSVHVLSGATGAVVAPIATEADGLVVFDTGDIYDSRTAQWSQTDSLEQQGYVSDVAVTVGDLAIFAGGATITGQGQVQPTAAVHIYNARTGQWSTAQLSQPRFGMAAASVGDLVLFGGGGPDSVAATDVVDMYNARTGEWSVAHLSQARNTLAATAVGNLAIFAGGQVNGQESDRADVFDAATGEWFTSSISVARSELAATTAGGEALFAGGVHLSYGPPNASPQIVEVFAPVPRHRRLHLR